MNPCKHLDICDLVLDLDTYSHLDTRNRNSSTSVNTRLRHSAS